MTHLLTPHRAIANRVKELREGRGWSAQRLGEEIAKLGTRLDRSIVTNFESGRRSYVTVEEWLVLAYVLDVAPVHLLMPIDANEDTPYQLVPVGGPIPALPVRAWIRGQTIIDTVDPKQYFSEVPDAEWQAPSGWPWTPERYQVGRDGR
ncbi:helix-turn-helix domain-containing protein [Salinispora fenicalii]|uniref:helix-turn-helix domain-containing protein n=1 Tax=Salinispora fenicalii TaxID=1137263 RepID=UPI0012BD0872|nr:helix-turn-helix transcriptional regulator [Salinispora fenicalii]